MQTEMKEKMQEGLRSEMQKPAIVMIDELKEKIRSDINESGIHWVLLEPLIRDLYEEVQALSRKMADAEREAYQKSVVKNNADNKTCSN
ncbi:hypothetical protein [Diplocloster agilis]|nr:MULTISPECIES: hypothetical protein [Lachnospiraceae]MCU6736853.1 hypothetical protein [Suonthocola fibrivorans]SCJ94000.1 Uncharacterised protein [uncultured Clostridium sp.]